MMAMDQAVQSSGLEASFIELVKMRASQINGCAFCVHVHTRDARAEGETEERVQRVDAWRESPLYTERERAALARSEAIAREAQGRVPDEVYEQVLTQLDGAEAVKLTMLVITINAWNRIAVRFGSAHPTKVVQAA